jgi:hypothetical protein
MATPGLLKELERAEEVLGELKSRYYLLRAFQEEVDARIGRRKIPIQNDHAWRMAFDTRDALTIHLASWAKRALSSGGLFGQLKASLGALYVPKAKSKAIGPQSRRELFERLFPGAASRGKVLPSDIDVLTDRYVDVGLARPKRRSRRPHLVVTINASLSPVVKYHGLARLHLQPFRFPDAAAA